MFAAGCFWGTQAYFDQVPGVVATTVGYTGGHVANPTYQQVCTHTTGHAEACNIEFDPHVITYANMLRHFFRMHDPTQINRQGPDVGDNYRSAIFYVDNKQKQLAEDAKAAAQANFKKPIATQIVPLGEFYAAEDYHQKFFQKTGMGACHVPYAPLAGKE